MRKPGTDPSNVRMSDVLCDFCLREWRDDLPFIEGHHGSCICGDCVRDAYRRLALAAADDRVGTPRCPLCLEERSEPCWRSPARPEAFACRRCVLMAAKALERDRDSGWKRPTAEATA